MSARSRGRLDGTYPPSLLILPTDRPRFDQLVSILRETPRASPAALAPDLAHGGRTRDCKQDRDTATALSRCAVHTSRVLRWSHSGNGCANLVDDDTRPHAATPRPRRRRRNRPTPRQNNPSNGVPTCPAAAEELSAATSAMRLAHPQQHGQAWMRQRTELQHRCPLCRTCLGRVRGPCNALCTACAANSRLSRHIACMEAVPAHSDRTSRGGRASRATGEVSTSLSWFVVQP